MAENLTAFSITAPGFLGLNTQDSPVDMDSKFALEASNCVIDKFGRVGARKGWVKANASANADLSTSNVECIGELVQNDGTRTVLAAGGGYLFKFDGTDLVTLTYGGGAVAPTITENNWLFTQLNGIAIFFQRGYDPLIYDPAVSTSAFRRLSEHASYTGTVPLANCAVSAYGRIWCADTTTDKNTVTWSDIISPVLWTAGSAGTLNLVSVWPFGGDEIVALAAHNGFLVVFGTKQTLIYSGADDPSNMALSDSLSVGCAARDSVQTTGSDIIFLSDTGVRSLTRTIQEKSAPLRTISRNVNNDIQSYLDAETAGNHIKSIYSPIDDFYLITFPTSNAMYCFDMRTPLEDGSSRATTWVGMNPKAFCYSKNRVLYVGKAGYLGEYSGYLDDAAQYRLAYYTSWLDFGNPIAISILKKIIMTLFGTLNQTVVYKWGFDYVTGQSARPTVVTDTTAPSEYNISEYGIGEYTRNLVVKTLGLPASGSGRVVQVGLEVQINGYPISLQRVDVYTKEGRLP
jgi:hypothetical protein